MIADLDATIHQLLVQELPIHNGEIDVKFDQPTREWSARLAKPTLNLFLYDIRENNKLRQHQWQQIPERNGRSTQSSIKKRTPYRLDCFYMISCWASEPDDEHRLLTRTLMALFKHPILPDERLQGSLREPVFEIQAHLAQHDVLTNPAEVWSALDNEMRPSCSYVVTLALDPWEEITDPIVRTATLHIGQATTLPHSQQVDSHASTRHFVGGTVWQGTAPLAQATVLLDETGYHTRTDGNGRFRLGGIQAGDYTLIATLPDGSTKKTAVTIPDENYDVHL